MSPSRLARALCVALAALLCSAAFAAEPPDPGGAKAPSAGAAKALSRLESRVKKGEKSGRLAPDRAQGMLREIAAIRSDAMALGASGSRDPEEIAKLKARALAVARAFDEALDGADAPRPAPALR